MTHEQIRLARGLRRAGATWKDVSRELGVNIHSLKYHLVAKFNPSSVAARHRAWHRWASTHRTTRSTEELQ